MYQARQATDTCQGRDQGDDEKEALGSGFLFFGKTVFRKRRFILNFTIT